MRAPTVCAEPGCPNVASSGGRCPAHARPDRWAAGASGRAISARPWRRTRDQVLARDPVCRIAGPRCTTVATEVDHIVRGAGDHDTNLQGACHPCHQAKTQTEAAAARRPRERM